MFVSMYIYASINRSKGRLVLDRIVYIFTIVNVS